MNELEVAKLLLDEWKFRQSHCWRSLQTFMLAAVSVSIAPYLLEKGKLTGLGKLLLLFPIVGGLIAVVAVWLYAAEYVRCQAVLNSYESILKNHGRDKAELTPPLSWRIGWFVIWFLGIGSVVLAALNTYAANVILLAR